MLKDEVLFTVESGDALVNSVGTTVVRDGEVAGAASRHVPAHQHPPLVDEEMWVQ